MHLILAQFFLTLFAKIRLVIMNIEVNLSSWGLWGKGVGGGEKGEKASEPQQRE
jgi:hypothetical protein